MVLEVAGFEVFVDLGGTLGEGDFVILVDFLRATFVVLWLEVAGTNFRGFWVVVEPGRGLWKIGGPSITLKAF